MISVEASHRPRHSGGRLGRDENSRADCDDSMLTAPPQVAPLHLIKSSMFSMRGSLHWAATKRQCSNKEPQMPVKIESFEPLSEEEFTALRQ